MQTAKAPFRFKRPSVVPGFGLALGFTLLYLALVVLMPLSELFLHAARLSRHDFIAVVTSRRVMAAYRISFGMAFLAALINSVFGFIIAWVLVRYRLPMKRLVDALIDLPFALPTSIAGIALSALYAPSGWMGRALAPLHIKLAFNPGGIAIALIFVGLPFVVRTVQPVLSDMDGQAEEAAKGLGANGWQTFIHIILPHVMPALLTGFAMAFARGLGEYGSVIFIAGNMPMVSEIVPWLIVTRLEEYDYNGATAIALVMLLAAFALLLLINLLQRLGRERA